MTTRLEKYPPGRPGYWSRKLRFRLIDNSWSPTEIVGTVFLAHDGVCEEPLEQLKASLLASGIRILEIFLIKPHEPQDRLIRYDIPMLARRLAEVGKWAEQNGLGGQSCILATGNAVAAALWLSSKRDSRICSVVGIRGRPHLAEPALGSVRVPTLLLVDADDGRAQHMNRIAGKRLGEVCELRKLTAQNHPQQVEDTVAWVQRWVSKRQTSGTVGAKVASGIPALALLRSLISLALFFSLLTI